ncbi:metallophosphoesterase [Lysobacter capsici]|uniref:metallophosphoesterase n=1 Tax=Lysobacter capsici TaxID=435897 RepID=UPI000A46B6E3|nr:metallophosphoesterase [Lysobacter capsici]
MHVLLGNHETMVLYDDLRYVNPKYLRSAELLGKPYPQLYDADSVLGAWLRTLPTMLKIDDLLFVHGGIEPGHFDLHLDRDAVNARYRQSLGLAKTTVKQDPLFAPLYDGKTSLIWYRGYFKQDELSQNDVQTILDRLGVSRIVVGHTSMEHVGGYFDGRVIAVDSSIKDGRSGELLFVENGRLERGMLDGKRVPL